MFPLHLAEDNFHVATIEICVLLIVDVFLT